MSAAQPVDPERFFERTQESRAVVERAIAALNRGDFETYVSLFAPDFTFHMPGTTPVSGTTRGIEQFMAVVGKVAARLSRMITLEVTNLIAGGEWVVTESKGTATTLGGAPYNNTYCHLFKVRDGRIVQFVEYNDSSLVERVLFA